jgi:triosephosphate isomerase (TIM)
MKEIYAVGNWKSNKTVSEAKAWMLAFAPLLSGSADKLAHVKIIMCAPYTDLAMLNSIIYEHNIPIELGAQAVSPYAEGAYTGQITAKMLSELVRWVIIGHSERRKYFHETDEDLASQSKMAKAAGLSVIYCVPDDKTPIPEHADIVGYEPTWAIGTGKTDTPQNASAVIANIKNTYRIQKTVYGGSVSEANVHDFVSQETIDGVLVGGASLDPAKFHALVLNAAS